MGDFGDVANPWIGSDSHLTPFDTEFYLILNVAVGGTNGFFPDDAVNGGGAPKLGIESGFLLYKNQMNFISNKSHGITNRLLQ